MNAVHVHVAQNGLKCCTCTSVLSMWPCNVQGGPTFYHNGAWVLKWTHSPCWRPTESIVDSLGGKWCFEKWGSKKPYLLSFLLGTPCAPLAPLYKGRACQLGWTIYCTWGQNILSCKNPFTHFFFHYHTMESLQDHTKELDSFSSPKATRAIHHGILLWVKWSPRLVSPCNSICKLLLL